MSGVLIFLWHTEFFSRFEDEFGVLVEVAARMLDQSNLHEAWIKVDMCDDGDILVVLEVESGRGIFKIGVRCFWVIDEPVKCGCGESNGDGKLIK